MAGFLFRLETVDGKPADPPTLSAAVPNWNVGESIYLGHRTLRVVPVLVVEDEVDGGSSNAA